MGKIRIKAFDESSAEDEAKLKAKREAKKAQKEADKARVSGMGGGQRVKTVGPTEEELEAVEVKPEETLSAEATDKPAKKAKKEKFANASKKIESKRHKENQAFVSKSQSYNIDQALLTLKKFKRSKFDETVELHINTKEKGVSGQITLPHGTGKTLRIKIADEATINNAAKGKIDFDVLVATPSMMPQLARVAKVLGPRGLMPNPKNGTISENPEDAVKKLSAGQINYKTESDAPVIHAIVGKVSFEDGKLKENISTFLTTIGSEKIHSVTLKSTMSPAIRLQF